MPLNSFARAMYGTHPEQHPAALILSEQAGAYGRLLSQQQLVGVPFSACREPIEALACYRGQPIVLGEPALVAQVVDQLPGVQWIQSTWAGVKPLLDLGRRPWSLTGIKDIFGPQMSEYVCGYLLAHELRLLERSHHQHRQTWFSEDSGSLKGKRAGIMGTGSIGRDIARMLKAFGVKTRGLNRTGDEAKHFDRTYPVGEMAEFLAGLDYLVAALPETPSTDNLLDEHRLGQLPPHAVLVNVGRGNVVNEHALAKALESGTLGGAVLDVFETEPLPTDSPLWSAPRLIITGHVAARSRPEDIVPLFLENYRRFAAGEPLNYLVDFERGY